MVRVTTDALHGHSFNRRAIAVTFLALTHRRQHQILTVLRFLRLVTGQARCIAGELALDLVTAMIETSRREVIAREADWINLEAVVVALAARVHDDVTGDGAATANVILDPP